MPTAAEPLLQPAERSRPVGHVLTVAVDAGGLLHRRLHLVADGGDAVVAPAACAEQAALIRRTSSAACAATLGGGPPAEAAYSAAARPGAGTEDQALGQRVGAQPVGAVDAHARGLSGGVQAAERRSLRRCRCGRRPSCSARRAGPGSARSPGRSARTSGTARGRTGSWPRSASRRGGAGRGATIGPYGESDRAALLDLVRRRPARAGPAGPSSMLRSSGVGVGLPRS